MPGRRADANDAVVGRNIRSQRLAREMSQGALAKRIGVTFQQVQKYEKGVNRVGAGRLMRVAAALDLPLVTLLDGASGLGKAIAPSAAEQVAQPVRLMKAFSAIEDARVRHSLVALVEGIARSAQRGQGKRI